MRTWQARDELPRRSKFPPIQSEWRQTGPAQRSRVSAAAPAGGPTPCEDAVMPTYVASSLLMPPFAP